MNRKLLILGAIFLAGLKISAQNSISEDWNSMFEKVKESKYLVSKVLWDYGMSDSMVLKHTGSRNDEYSDYSIWSGLYQTWENSYFGTEKKIQSYDSIRNLFSDYHKRGISVVPVVWVEGDRIKSGAFDDGALQFDTVSNQIEMVDPARGFEKANVFASVPFVQTSMTHQMKLLFSKQFFYTNSNKQLLKVQMKVDQGVFETIQLDEILVLQLQEGIHTVELLVELENWPQLSSRFDLYIKDIEPGKGNSGFNKFLQIGDEFGNIYTSPYRNTETGEALGAFISVFPGSTNAQLNTCIKKPIIFVEGIDFGYKDHMTGCYGGKCGNVGFRDLLYGKLFNPYTTNNKKMYEDWEPIKKAPALIDQLKNNGYDLIYLDFHNGADYMENNAMLLVELIKRVNAMKCSNEELVVIGASMGGQVTRFALSYMEQNNMNHCVREFVSFDSPNRGANIPLGFQHFIKYFSGKLPGVKDEFNRKIKRPATQQLLCNSCMSYNGAAQDALKNEFDSKISKLLDFPKYPRSVAVLNGCIKEVSQGFAPGDKLLEMNPYVGTLNFDFLEINTTVWSSFARINQVNLVMQGKMIGSKRYWANVPEDTKQIDHIQGSKRFDLKDARTIFVVFNIINREDATCFIPTFSALNFNKELSSYDYDLNLEKNKHNKGVHSFDAFYGPNDENQEHMMITNDNMNWMVNQINANRNDLPSYLTQNYNFGRIERNTIAQVEIQSNVMLKVNGLGLTGLGNGRFDVPVEEGCHFELYSSMCEPVITVQKDAQLVIGEVSRNRVNTATLYLRKGAVLKLKEGAVLRINNLSKLIVEEGAKLIYSKGARIVLDGNDAVLQIDGDLELENQSVFKIEHSTNQEIGYVKFRNMGGGYGKAKINVNSGTAQFDLKGTDKTKGILQIEGVVDFTGAGKIDSVSITSCKVMYGNHSKLILSNKVFIDEVDFSVLPWATQKLSTALELQNGQSVEVKNCSFKGFDTGLKHTLGKGLLLKISNSEFKNNTIGVQINSKYIQIEHSSFYNNETVGIHLISNFKDAYLKSNVFYNNAKGVWVDKDNIGNNHQIMMYDCQYYNNQQAVVSYYNQLSLKCCRFDNNAHSFYSNNAAVLMSHDVYYNGYWGKFQTGNCTFIHSSNKCIELIESVINVSNGYNNFIYKGNQSIYNFIVGSIQLDVQSLYPNSFDLNVNQNHWFPSPNSDWTKEVGRFYNIDCYVPISGATISYFRGNNLNSANTTCYNIINQSADGGSTQNSLTGTHTTLVLGQELKIGLNLYPIPASKELNVTGLMDLGVKEIKIINTNGTCIEICQVESNDLTIDVSLYSDGLYYLVYESNEGLGHMVFVVKH